jgi:hypothetical protein
MSSKKTSEAGGPTKDSRKVGSAERHLFPLQVLFVFMRDAIEEA